MATVSVINRPIILIVTMLLLFAGSCSDSNNPVDPGDIDTDPDPIPTSEINTSFENDNSNFLPGEFQRILIEGASLTEDQITAKITGSEEVTLYRDTTVTEGEAVLFIVPEIAADTYTLTFTLEEQEQVLDFVVEIFEEIENPEQFTNDAIIRLDNELDAIQQEVTDQAVLDSIKAVRADLDRASTEINELSENEKKLVARIIHTHNEYLRSEVVNNLSKLNTIEEQCEALKKDLLRWNIVFGGTVSATAVSLYLIKFQPLVGSILTGVSAGTLLVSADKFLEVRENLSQKCPNKILSTFLEEIKNINLNRNSIHTLASSNSEIIAFNHGQEKAFIIKSEFDFSEEIKQILQEIREALADIIDLLPDALSEKLMKDDFREERQRDPAPFSIQNISDDRIEGGTAVNGEQFMITFNYKTGQMPDETQDFTFELEDDDDTDQVTTIETNLEPAFLPVAFDDSISVNIDESRTDTLMAEMANGFEIVDFPSSGSVNLDDAALGIYTYTPNSGFEGEDKFTFKAFNEAGESNTAEIMINIEESQLFGTIAYVTGPPPAIYLINADGTNDKKIIEESARNISWNKKGDKILFIEGGLDGDDLFVVNSDGSNLQFIDDSRDAEWSNIDENKIVYSRTVQQENGRTEELWTIDLESNSKSRVVETDRSNGETTGMLKYGPKDELAYAWKDFSGTYLIVHGEEIISKELGSHCCINNFDWSPDGNKLVYQTKRQNNNYYELIVSEIAGVQNKIYNGHIPQAEPNWSPSGEWIAIDESENGLRSLYVIDPESGNSTKITQGRFLDWSPDGKWILFTKNNTSNDEYGIWAITPDGSRPILIKEGEYISEADWRK